MRKPEAVLDSSCVIALDALNLIPLLSFLFSRVLLPKAVRRELFRRRETKNRLRALLRNYNAFLSKCDDYDGVAVDLLLIERHAQGKRDRGEAESVVQASERAATLIIDDRWGRELGMRYGLKVRGTLWVLQNLYVLELRSADQIRADFFNSSAKEVSASERCSKRLSSEDRKRTNHFRPLNRRACPDWLLGQATTESPLVPRITSKPPAQFARTLSQ